MAPRSPKGPAARNLSFEAGPVPKFLQSLHRQVTGARNGGRDATSEFDELLGASSSSSARGGGEAEGEEDEFDGAQVVVLKEGKHLSREEALAKPAAAEAGSSAAASATAPAAGSSAARIASAGSAPSKKRRAPVDDDSADAAASGEGSMDAARAVIAASKGGKEKKEKGEKGEKGGKKDKEKKDKKRKKAAIAIPAMAMDGDAPEDFERAGAAPQAGEEHDGGLDAASGSQQQARAEGGAEDEAGEEEPEVEAISHKEQRKRRKLEKAAARAGAGSGGEAAGAAPNGAPSAAAVPLPGWAPRIAVATPAAAVPRTGHSLWIGNLSFRTTSERLKEWLGEKGLQGVSRVHMPAGAKRGEHNKGYAYVDVPDKAGVTAGVALSESHLDGRRLLIKAGSDYEGRPALDATALALAQTATPADAAAGEKPKQGRTGLTKTAQKILRAQKNPPAPTLFVGNLSFNTTEAGLRELIERSARTREEWASKRRPKEERKEAGKPAAPAEDAGSASPQPETQAADAPAAEAPATQDRKRKRDEKEKRPEGEIRGAGVRKIRMGEFEDSGKCKGFAFIDFHTPAHATASLIDPHNYNLDGREIKLQYAGADAVRRGAPKGANAGGEGGMKPWERPGYVPRPRPARTPYGDGGGEEAGGEAAPPRLPPPKPFDPDAPLEKRHKETQEERKARRALEAARGGGDKRRAKPGAALANAQRGQTGIVEGKPMGKKVVFD